MTNKEVKALLSQEAIPVSVQKQAYKKVLELMDNEKEVEVIASTQNITIDVYNEFGEKVDSFIYKFSTDYKQPSDFFKETELCGFL